MTIRRNIEKTTKLTVEQYNNNLSNSSSALIAGRVGEIVVDITTDPAYPTVYIANNLGFLNPFTGNGGGNGTPGGSNTQLQFNNNGSFGGISNVTWNGSTLSLGDVSTIRIQGGASNNVLATDGAGNLSWTNTVANATFATNSGSALVADTANSVDGANVVGQVANAAYAESANIANIANVAYSVDGANVSGQVANANFAEYANIVVGNNQPNILTLGNLLNLSVSGNAAVNAVLTDNYLYANGEPVNFNPNGTSNITQINAGTGLNGGGSSGAIILNISNTGVANGTYGSASIVPIFTVNDQGQLLSVTDTPISIPGTAVTSEVANAVYATTSGSAGSVDGANVVGPVANAAYSNISGVAYSVDGANVVGAVANATFAESANIAGTAYAVDGANVIGEVANAAYSNISGVAYSVDGANVVGQVASALLADAANVAAEAYLVSGANVSGEVANAAYATIAGTAYSVTGSNVSGEVANANYAAYAGNVTISNQPNITAVGNLVSLTVDGLTSLGNVGNVSITGGTSGEILTTDGLGNLSWQTPASPVVRIPAVYFTAPVAGNNQSFSNVELGAYATKQDMSVFYNGALIEYTYYDLTGDTLTINIPLAIGDSIDVATQLASNANPVGNYCGSFFSNVTQTTAGITSANPMTLNNTVISDGVSIVSGSQITVANDGRYNIEFSAQFVKTDASNDTIEIWLAQNGVIVPDSNTRLTIQGNGEAIVAAWNFVMPAAAGDYFELFWWSSDAALSILSVPPTAGPPERPAIPSVIVTVTPC